jgi:xanthine dehydrogenase molybdenum-binding subunit
MDLTLNGEPVSVDVRADMSLLELLRDELGVMSVKDGCAPEGSCGACTVLIDGKAVVSCAQKAVHAVGRSVVTQEGLPPEERERWADCFVASGASQWGSARPASSRRPRRSLAASAPPATRSLAARWNALR